MTRVWLAACAALALICAWSPRVNTAPKRYLDRGTFTISRETQLHLTELERSVGPNHPILVLLLTQMAEMHIARGQLAAAEADIIRAIEMQETAFGPNYDGANAARVVHAELMSAQGRVADAEALYRRLVEGPVGDAERLLAMKGLAQLYAAQARYAEAEPLYLQILAIEQRQSGPAHIDVAHASRGLAAVMAAQGRHDEAERLFDRAAGILAIAPDTQELERFLMVYAGWLRAVGKFEKAAAIQTRVMR